MSNTFQISEINFDKLSKYSICKQKCNYKKISSKNKTDCHKKCYIEYGELNIINSLFYKK